MLVRLLYLTYVKDFDRSYQGYQNADIASLKQRGVYFRPTRSIIFIFCIQLL